MNRILALNPCREAKYWLIQNKQLTLQELYNECPRGEWLLWLSSRVGIARELLVLSACDCAETALQYTSDPKPAKAIETARKWAYGTATLQEVCNDAYAAEAAYAADAADAAAYATYAADDAYAAAYAATYAADAAAADTKTDRTTARADNAALVRQRISFEVFEAALETKTT